ncbi:hypothetical protein HK096_009592, partial [Nowakowskiella sp. JEL0078]
MQSDLFDQWIDEAELNREMTIKEAKKPIQALLYCSICSHNTSDFKSWLKEYELDTKTKLSTARDFLLNYLEESDKIKQSIKGTLIEESWLLKSTQTTSHLSTIRMMKSEITKKMEFDDFLYKYDLKEYDPALKVFENLKFLACEGIGCTKDSEKPSDDFIKWKISNRISIFHDFENENLKYHIKVLLGSLQNNRNGGNNDQFQLWWQDTKFEKRVKFMESYLSIQDLFNSSIRERKARYESWINDHKLDYQQPIETLSSVIEN